MNAKIPFVFRCRLGSSRRLASIVASILVISGVPSLPTLSSPVRAHAALPRTTASPTAASTSTNPSCSTVTFSIENYADTTMVMKPDGSAYAWGLNNWGQLGNGTSTSYNPNSTPTEVVGENGNGFLGGLVSIAGSDANGGAVTADGSVYTWGASYLGDGTTNSSTTPIHVVGPSGSGYLTRATQLSCGNFATAWPLSRTAQYGLGDTTTTATSATMTPTSRRVPLQCRSWESVVSAF